MFICLALRVVAYIEWKCPKTLNLLIWVFISTELKLHLTLINDLKPRNCADF